MKLRILVLAVACFSCVVPPALGTGLLAAKAAAGAVKAAALLGAGSVAAKGAAVGLAAKGLHAAKGAALLAGKAAAVKGAALLSAKGAAIKGVAALATKGLAVGGALLGAMAVKTVASHRLHAPFAVSSAPVYYEQPVYVKTLSIPPVPPQFPLILAERLHGLWNIAATAFTKKVGAASELVSALHQAKKNALRPPPVVYEFVEAPKFYHVPLIQKTETDC